MQVKEISIEGFKSYKYKVPINGFDKYFNAITGLNGSGKSNIFDAICFVMGITTLSHMRATNLQELIYQNGKAEVKKATVSITFTNYNGLLDLGDEIIVSRTIYEGKSKFMINGKNQTQKDIQNLFQQAGLNINNPHFLIMQGKVMKVVNMSALDILGLLEEASGTSIYESKKDTSIKTMKKKEVKLVEVDKYLNEYITPKLQQLNKDRVNYLKWKDTEKQIFRLFKVTKASEYYGICKRIENEKDDKQKHESNMQFIIATLNKNVMSLKSVEDEIESLKSKVNPSISNELLSLENNLKEKNADYKAKQKEIKTVRSNIEKYQEEKAEFERKCKLISQEKSLLEKNLKIIKSDIEAGQVDLEAKNKIIMEFELNTNSNNSNNSNILLSNIQNALSDNDRAIKKFNSEQIQSKEEIKMHEQKIDYLNDEEKRINDNIKNIGLNKQEIEKKRENIINEIDYYERQIVDNHSRDSQKENKLTRQSINNIENNVDIKRKDLDEQIQALNFSISKNTNKIKDIQFNNKGLSLVFDDPERNFDRSKVKGRVISLFKITNQKYIKALERIAGGKLFNIVVDNNVTSSALLGKRCFRGAETLLPLNTIQSYDIDKNKREKIKKMFGDQAEQATDLIEYKSEFQTIMRYVFGITYICANNDIAKKLAYGNEFRIKCVNLDGDVFDPSGILTGGYMENKSSNILKAEECRHLESEIQAQKAELLIKTKEINTLNEFYYKYKDAIVKLEEIEREYELSNEQRSKERLMQIKAEKKSIQDNISMIDKRITDLINKVKEYHNKDINLKKELAEAKEMKGKNQKEALLDKVNKLKSEAENETKKLNSLRHKLSELNGSLSIKDSEHNSLLEQLRGEEKEIELIKKEREDINKEIESLKEQIKQIEIKLNIKKKEESMNIQELNNLMLEKENREKENDELNSKIKEEEHYLSQLDARRKNYISKIKEIETANNWIEKEKSLFGVQGSEYDFSNINIDEKKKEHDERKEENSFLEKKVNMKVDVLVDEFEKQYNILIEKRSILVNDKIKLEKAIIELDEKRKISVEKVFTFVNEKFDSIYKTFLPGAMAKLAPPDKKNLLKGLEMKVGFSGTWKNSLAELSGGQRSLLALSFILALLCHNPAPFYILDEVDAALDLSHTSNLGLMIKEHFPQSQFIIISLKDGMFSNANVLFQVSYIDGSSKVQRIVKELKNAGRIIKK